MEKNFDREKKPDRFGWTARGANVPSHGGRRLLALALGALVAVSTFAAPFAQKVPFTQPDGTVIELWGEGDEFHAVFETLDGYTVVFDPATKAYCYATLAGTGELVSTGTEVHRSKGAALGLNKGLRMHPDVRRREARARYQKWEAGMQIQQRWDAHKAGMRRFQQQRVPAAAAGGGTLGGDASGAEMAPPSSQTTGTKVGLTLLVDFSDDVATISQSEINNYCNSDNYTGYGNNGSVRRYFWDVSGGTLTYTNVVTVYVRVPQPKTYYNDTSKDAGGQANILIRDAITAMKSLPNYTTEILPQFENLTVDGSQNVIACNVFYAGGNGGVWSKGLWPHSWSLYNVGAQELSAGGKKVYRYQITNIGTSLVLGTFCHENGHMLCGFPDIYDYGYDSKGGAGVFCLMDYGGSGGNPIQVCAYLRRAAGWLTPIELTSSSVLTATVTAAVGATPGQAYRYQKSGVATEYYLVENRQKTGRDANLPAAGVAIWHIDELGSRDNQSTNYNTIHANYEVSLIQADNLYHFQKNLNSGDANDLYYASNTAAGYLNQFTDVTAPSARWWDGSLSLVNFQSFSASGSTMTFLVGAPITLTIATDSPLPSGMIGVAYNQTLTAMGGSTPYTWSIAAGSLPSGLSLSSGGVISGTPGASATASFTLKVTDNDGVFTTKDFTLAINQSIASFDLSADPGWTRQGEWAYGTPTGGGGTSYGYADPTGGATGASVFGINLSGDYSTSIGGPYYLTTGPINLTGYTGTQLRFKRWLNTDYPPYAYATVDVSSDGTNWTNLFTNPGAQITENAWTTQTYTLGPAMDNKAAVYIRWGHQVGSGAYAYSGWNIDDVELLGAAMGPVAPTITTSSPLPSGRVGFAYSQTLAATGGATPYTWSITAGSLPSGLDMDSNGVISGMPDAETTASFTVRVAGNDGLSSTKDFSLTIIIPMAPVITTGSPLPSGAVSAPYSVTLTATGGTSPYVWSLAAGNLPSGLGLTSAGVISGTPGVTTNASFTIQVTGNDSLSSTKDFDLTINPMPSPQITVISAGTSNYAGTFIVGTNDSFYGLIVTNAGILTSSGGVIGNSALAAQNFALVSGAGSFWSNAGSLTVGYTGSFNQLTINNSGRVVNSTGFIGYNSVSSNNSVLVTDAGSVWSNSSTLSIGSGGSSNSLTIANGGRVFNTIGYVGGNGSASNNAVVVTGAGSFWSNSSTLYLGYSGAFNTLTIAASGRVNNTTGYIGYNASASNNTVWVTDAGSLWSNSSSLSIGNNGSGNGMVITNSGQVFDTSGYIGSGSSSSNNWVIVTDSGSLWSNSSSMYIGLSGAGNSLIITNGGRVFNSIGDIGVNLTASNNWAIVTGAGSLWSNSSILYVGASSPGNSLSILDGGQVIAGSAIVVGNNTSAYGNTLLASNAGYIASVGLGINSRSNIVTLADHTLWNLRGGGLTIGYGVGAFGNTLSIDASSALTNIYGLTLGENNTTFYMTNSADGFVFNEFTTNQLRFANGFGVLTVGSGPGAGTTLIVSNYVASVAGLTIGNSGSRSNTVTLLDNSVWNLAGKPLAIGSGIGSYSNMLSIDASSALTNIYGLTLGENNITYYMTNSAGGFVFNEFTTNQLRFSNGFGGLTIGGGGSSGTALILSNYLLNSMGLSYIGNSGTNSALLVTGPGAVWSNNNTVYVGVGGSGNNMTITNGGRVVDYYGYIGSSSGYTNNWVLVTGAGSLWGNSNNLYVGNYGSNNNLTIADGGWVTNSFGYLGYNAGSTSHWVRVTDAGSVWSNGSTLYVGNSGVSNNLTVANSGLVISASGYIGYNSSASNNAVVVTGAGSLWTNVISLTVGNSGSGNRLAISNSGQVICGLRYIGYNASASNNVVLVADAGSIWSNNNSINGALYVGYYGPNNNLIITNGGQVFSVSGTVGSQTGSINNSMLVTGFGSVWNAGSNLYVGNSGSSNSLTIAGGGQVFAINNYIGYNTSASNNLLTVTDAGTLLAGGGEIWIGNSGVSNTMRVLAGAVVTNSGWVQLGRNSSSLYNTLLVSGSQSLLSNAASGILVGNGGFGNLMVVTNSGAVMTPLLALGWGASSVSNTVIVAGTGTLLRTTGSGIAVGTNGAFNTMIVNSGAVITNLGRLVVGGSAAATGNFLLVSGPGTWLTNGQIRVGDFASGNSMVISNGAVVVGSSSAYIGAVDGANSNAVWVIGPGSAWANSFLTVGNAGFGNRLTIAGGGQVSIRNWAEIGGGSNASNNQVFLTDSGSAWSNASTITVGSYGSSNCLVVANGGQAFSGGGTIGYMPAASNNSVLVTGSGSVWSNATNLTVGLNGSFNSLAIANSGQVFSSVGYVGRFAGASNNSVSVDGSGSLWNNSTNLHVGDNGVGNRLTIAAGGRVLNQTGFVGNASIASNNSVLLTGSGSLWSNSTTLYVGNSGSFNSLSILGGGEVRDNTAYIGNNSNNNSVLVSGSGSLWNNNADFYVGNSGSSNRLTVANGGRVLDTIPWIGFTANSSNNLVEVNGAGSVLSNSVGMNLGFYGSSNRVTVTSGGQLLNGFAHVAYNATASNNSILVSDAGSVWSNSGGVEIGLNGSFNSLVIANTGRVFGVSAWIGRSTSAFYNTALVTGSGSVWSNTGSLFVGATGSFNRLTVTNGGRVVSSNGWVGYVAGASNNTVLVTGAGSVWSNIGALSIGGGPGNTVTLADGSMIYASALSNFSGSIFSMTSGSALFGSVFNAGSIVQSGGQQSAGYATNFGSWILATGAVANVSSFFNQAGGQLVGMGGTLNGSVTGGGALSFGSSFSAFTVSGDVTLLAGATTLMDLGGTGDGFLDRLTLGGQFTADGTLTVSLLDGFVPQDGDVFNLLDYGSAAGAFSQINLPTGDGWTWDVSHLLAPAADPLSGSIVFNPSSGVSDIVDGVVTNAAGAYVLGDATARNMLLILNAGVLMDTSGIIGNQSTSSFNRAVVTGPGSVWSNANALFVGYAGSANQLSVTNGGAVWAAESYVGFDAGAHSNSVFVGGAGSVWSNTGVLAIGGGLSNRVTLADGGRVYAGVLSNLSGSLFSMGGGSAFFGNVWNSGVIAQTGGLLDPGFFNNAGLLQLSGGTNVATAFLNQAGGIVQQSSGELDVNIATNFGSWRLSGGVANFTNFVNEGNATLIVSGGVLAGSLTLGDTGSSSQLTVTNGGAVSSDGSSYLGYQPGSSNNGVWVTGAGSVWNAGTGSNNGFFIGHAGSFNTLSILDGGSVLSFSGVVGQTESSGNNSVLVSGSNSVWNNSSNLCVGYLGVGNSLAITDGGRVFNAAGHIGLQAYLGYMGFDFSASNNSVLVSGAGSLWSNSNYAAVGIYGSSNSLVVADGGKVFSRGGFIGLNFSGSNNSALVTGSGSLWSSSDEMRVGNYGSANWLTIANSGQVSGTYGRIGANAGSSNNAVLVTGSNSLWSSSLNLFVGSSGPTNRLTVADGGWVTNRNGYIGFYPESGGNSVLVMGTGSTWRSHQELQVGRSGSENTLTVTNGGRVLSAAAAVGSQSGSVDNIALVLGAGSLWSNTTVLSVGGEGWNNSMVIGAGGTVLTATGFVGAAASASNNAVTVIGAGSLWNNTNSLYIGLTGSFNSLTIADGGRVLGQTGCVGNAVSSSNNTVLVTGAGSTWSNAQQLRIGVGGSGNSLTIANSGLVAGFLSWIGNQTNASGNSALVTGTGSVWRNSSSLYVGDFGRDNSLLVTNGGIVAGGYGYVGLNASGSNNTATVAGIGSIWTNSGILGVGWWGSRNSLLIAGGAQAFSATGHVGYAASASNNTVTVDGAGSFWSNVTSLYVGSNGSGNSLTVTNGARLISPYAYLGGASAASNNTVIITGVGSTWSNSQQLRLGVGGSGNLLTVRDGGQVLSVLSWVGNQAGSGGNAITVTGAGSLWRNNNSLYMGDAGSSNSLVISDGGLVTDTFGYLGLNGTASNNAATVTGGGSIWSNSSILAVGWSGSRNSLAISDGGVALSATGYIGYAASASNNAVTVSGAGSLWSNSYSLFVGSNSPRSSLTLNDDGVVFATNIVMGAGVASTGNTITVSGGSLLATNGTGAGALDVRRGTLTFNGGSITADRFYVTNNTLVSGVASNYSFFSFNAGTLTTRSGSRIVVPYNNSFVIGATPGETAIWDVLGGTNTVLHNVQDSNDRVTAIGNVTGAVGIVNVSGAGTFWSNSHSLRIGNVSAGNQLNITGGARVGNGFSTVGNSASADNNTILVSGPGSVWSNRNDYTYGGWVYYGSMVLGNYGSSNSLTINDGGTVWVGHSGLVVGAQTGAVDNSVMVDGGFLWITTVSGGVLDVRRGSFTLNSGTATVNRLVATNGANSIVNFNGGTLNNLGTLISNGTAFVVGGAGTGATLNLSGDHHTFVDGLVVGNTGADNLARIAGGIVETPRLWVGALEGARSNAVLLSDGVLTVADGSGGGLFDVLRGSFTLNSGTAVVDRLLVTNGAASVVNLNGGRLDVADIVVSNGVTFAVGDGTRSATLNLLAGSHSFADGLVVSSNSVLAGSGTMLLGGVTMTNYGTIAVGVLGRVPGGLTNAGDLVEAAGSVLEIGAGRKDGLDCGFLRVLGGVMLDGRLDVALQPYYLDGGGLISSTDVFTVLTANSPLAGVFSNVASGARLDSVEQIGSFLVTYSGNNVVLSGFQSGPELGLLTVTNLYTTNTLLVGDLAPGNGLVVTNGGVLESALGVLGRADSSSNNWALVTGIGSIWSNAESLRIGNFGPGNQMTISGSGVVSGAEGVIGWGGASTNNAVIVTGGGSIWTNSERLYVGYGGSLNQLAVNGGFVGNQTGYVGYASGANSNLAVVSGAGSLWSNYYDLHVGYSGSFNQLTVAAAGRVASRTGYVGFAEGASGNAVLVSGAGSVWSNYGNVYLGYSGSGNQLTATNGGQVLNGFNSSYVGYNGVASGNAALVSGSGSIWSNRYDLYVGSAGSGNQVVVNDGGLLVNRYGYIGYNAGADNNAVLLTGAGSVWTNSGDIYVGNFGSGNQLFIGGGAVALNNDGFLGNNAISSNNSVLVTGPGSTWNQSGYLYVGDSGSSNTLAVTSSGVVMGVRGLIGDNASASNNAVIVAGAGSVWSNSENLYLGNYGPGNGLTISGGGQLFDVRGHVGNNTSSSNNTVIVAGAGSVWSNSENLYLGNNGSSNSLAIVAGGQVFNVNGYVGYTGSSSNNYAVVADSGSLWSQSGTLYVGYSGWSNNLAVTNGGRVFSGGGVVGRNSGSNFAVVAGPGSVWSNGGDFHVGYAGSFNEFIVSDGSRVFSSRGYVGNTAGADNNCVWITGIGSVWNNSSVLYIGNSGASNSLTIANGGVVFNQTGYVGNAVGANNNSVLVAGSGSVWSNASDIYIGNSSSGNSLTIGDGGWVTNYNAYLGYAAGANSNAAVVTGAGSVWSNGFAVTVGRFGSMNSLTITNGGGVFGLHGSIGYYQESTGNWAVVAGSGSLWSNYQQLYVGRYGSNNSLTIAGGARALSGDGAVGLAAGNGGNAALVTGAGSVWSNRSLLQIGRAGSNNSLTVSGGGQVFNTLGYVGGLDGGSNNSATVTGAGSLWNNDGDLFIGATGAFNQLVVTNGGWVVDTNAFIGFNASASNNSVLVTGAGSVWSNAGVLTVGSGPGNSVTVADGGWVYAAAVSNLSDSVFNLAGGSACAAQVTNSGSWTVSDSGLLEVRDSLTVAAVAGLTNRDGGSVRLVSNATLNLSGSFVVTNATLEFAGASSYSTPFLPGVSFQNGAGVAWSGYGGSFGDHAITANLNLDLPSGPGLARGIVDNARLAIGGDGFLYAGSNNLVALTITNGGQALGNVGFIAFDAAASNSSGFVSGPGSVWSNSDSLFVGYHGPLASLTLTDGGSVFATNLVIGFDAASTGNVITVSGGRLYATNADGGGALDVRYGALTLNSGTVTVDRLLLTNGANSVFNFNGGVLNAAQMLSTKPVTINGGTLALADSFVNLPESTFQLNNGSVIVPNVVVNLGTFIQNGGLFDPAVFTNSGPWTLTGGTNVDEVFLNLAPGTVLQSGGEHNVNVATNFGVWTLSGGVANLTNLVLDAGGVFTNAGGALVSTNAAGLGGLDVRNGSFVLNGGTTTVDRLYATNGASSALSFSAGWLATKGTVISNATLFTVGDGVQSATLRLDGGSHLFADGLVIATNSLLTGAGVVSGSNLAYGAILADGAGAELRLDAGLRSNINLGLLGALNGATLTLPLGTLTNAGLIALSGGTLGTQTVLVNLSVLVNSGGTFAVTGMFDNHVGAAVTNGGSLTTPLLLNAGQFTMTGGTHAAGYATNLGSWTISAASPTSPTTSAKAMPR